jgi:Large eukaryotic DNA virus major capsid protein/Major capsid protein N-terminus
MSSQDYFRPRGDITTVLDLTDRDAQDNTYFPINTDASWFHSGPTRSTTKEHESIPPHTQTVYPTASSVQEFPQRGPAEWGQKCTFELSSLSTGDLLQSVGLQLKLGSWYTSNIISQLTNAAITTDTVQYANSYWTYINGLGSSIIEYAEFVVNDQTIERITGEFIRTYLSLQLDQNAQIGTASDAVGSIPYSYLSSTYPSTANPVVQQTMFRASRPYPIEDGIYFCVLPFFFFRTKLKEIFPLLSCNEGNVRVDIKLRPFDQVVRQLIGYRTSSMDTPLNKSVPFITVPAPSTTVTTTTLTNPPPFRDFKMVTCSVLTTGSLRNRFLRQPFEQMVKLVQHFSFEEPLKYLVSKPNPNTDTVDIQLPLELNHPVVELLWVFRRKAVKINNEWSNFSPSIGVESNPDRVVTPWLQHATIRMNGSELISADGDWFRQHIAEKHSGGITAYQSHVYGYSFAEYPEEHQPSGTANMSRTTSVTLTMRVNQPITMDLTTLSNPNCEFDPVSVGGWEIFVYAVYYNWLRFENGICNRMFTD